jgi:hypothetical protein
MFAIALIDSVAITRRAVRGAGPSDAVRTPRRPPAAEAARLPRRVARHRTRPVPARVIGTEGP